LDGRGFVGGVIVDDQMERAAARDLVVNRLKELAELHRPMAAMKLPDHGARLEVERGEQVGSAVTQIVGSTPLRLAGAHRQQRLAVARVLQCVASAGARSKVMRTTRSICASPTWRGAPGRGSSSKPASRRSRNRWRHLPTVWSVTPSLSATAVLGLPLAHSRTIRERWA